MTHFHVPKGWIRAAALQINTAPSPYITDPRVLAVVVPYHTTPADAAKKLNFTDAESYNAWQREWFAAPLPNPDPSFTKQFASRPEQPPPNPFAAPKAAVQNPFEKPVVKNPFDLPKSWLPSTKNSPG